MKKDINNLKDMMYKKLAEHNLKVTPQRITIFEELIKCMDHPSTETIYTRVKKIMPNISFDTVYRTLLSFSEIGLIDVVECFEGKKRFDINTEPHHHFRCIKCNSLIDFKNKEYDSLVIPEDIKKRFTVLNKKVFLEGICKNCTE